MTDPGMGPSIEAIRERLAKSEEWAKATGYKAYEYYDTQGDIRFLLAELAASQARWSEGEEAIRALGQSYDALRAKLSRAVETLRKTPCLYNAEEKHDCPKCDFISFMEKGKHGA